jgi:hypothetical protein
MAARRRLKQRFPKACDRTEPTTAYGRGKERFERVLSSVKKVEKFTERDTSSIRLITFEPAGPECIKPKQVIDLREGGADGFVSVDIEDHTIFPVFDQEEIADGFSLVMV